MAARVLLIAHLRLKITFYYTPSGCKVQAEFIKYLMKLEETEGTLSPKGFLCTYFKEKRHETCAVKKFRNICIFYSLSLYLNNQ